MTTNLPSQFPSPQELIQRVQRKRSFKGEVRDLFVKACDELGEDFTKYFNANGDGGPGGHWRVSEQMGTQILQGMAEATSLVSSTPLHRVILKLREVRADAGISHAQLALAAKSQEPQA